MKMIKASGHDRTTSLAEAKSAKVKVVMSFTGSDAERGSSVKGFAVHVKNRWSRFQCAKSVPESSQRSISLSCV